MLQKTTTDSSIITHTQNQEDSCMPSQDFVEMLSVYTLRFSKDRRTESN